MNAMKKVIGVARTHFVTTQEDLTDAPARLVSLETDTTAQVCQCFSFVVS